VYKHITDASGDGVVTMAFTPTDGGGALAIRRRDAAGVRVVSLDTSITHVGEYFTGMAAISGDGNLAIIITSVGDSHKVRMYRYDGSTYRDVGTHTLATGGGLHTGINLSWTGVTYVLHSNLTPWEAPSAIVVTNVNGSPEVIGQAGVGYVSISDDGTQMLGVSRCSATDVGKAVIYDLSGGTVATMANLSMAIPGGAKIPHAAGTMSGNGKSVVIPMYTMPRAGGRDGISALMRFTKSDATGAWEYMGAVNLYSGCITPPLLESTTSIVSCYTGEHMCIAGVDDGGETMIRFYKYATPRWLMVEHSIDNGSVLSAMRRLPPMYLRSHGDQALLVRATNSGVMEVTMFYDQFGG